MVNTMLLKNTVRNKGFRLNFLSEKLGISYNAFYQKATNVKSFKPPEVYMLSGLLDLTEEEKNMIFFA